MAIEKSQNQCPASRSTTLSPNYVNLSVHLPDGGENSKIVFRWSVETSPSTNGAMDSPLTYSRRTQGSMDYPEDRLSRSRYRLGFNCIMLRLLEFPIGARNMESNYDESESSSEYDFRTVSDYITDVLRRGMRLFHRSEISK